MSVVLVSSYLFLSQLRDMSRLHLTRAAQVRKAAMERTGHSHSFVVTETAPSEIRLASSSCMSCFRSWLRYSSSQVLTWTNALEESHFEEHVLRHCDDGH